MGDAVGRIWIIPTRNVIEEDHRVMLGGIDRTIGHFFDQRAFCATYPFLIAFPTDAGAVEQCGQVRCAGLMVALRVTVVGDPEIRPGFEPQIIRLTRVQRPGVEILFRMARHGQQGTVYVWGRSLP